MPSHTEKRVLPYSAEQIYGLVADIEKYPEFLPWCLAARHLRREGDVQWSEMIIGFKFVRERFTSKVTFSPMRIDVEYIDGPLKYMQNHWIFIDLPDGRCEIDFFVDFEFKSRVLQKLIGALFHEAISRMVRAFEVRARALYGEDKAVVGRAKPA